MASDHGGGGCNKRCRQASSCADDNIGEMSGRVKRSANIDRDVYGRRAQETADDDGAGEDDMYLYDDDEDERDEEAKEDDDAACDKEEPRYVVLTEDYVRARQEADTARVAEVLSIPEGFAAVLLRHFKWRVGRLQEEWFSDGREALRDAVGLRLPADGGTPRSHYVCAICFDEHPAGRTRSAGCSHHYCDGCWRGYIHAAVGDGPRCLSLRCPDPACSVAVVQDLVDAVAHAEDKDRYARFALRSYSGGGIKWCPAPGCTRAVELLGDAHATDVFCDCNNGFCWSCGEEAHRPVSCDTVRAWLALNISEAETAKWILTNTKSCPSCGRPIEKNQGCNHMTCSDPCRHQFCWLCLDPWNDHKSCSSRYGHRRLQLQETRRRRQAKASVGRYLYHYERWAANGNSLHKALVDMDQLKSSELESMARAVDLPATELGFVTEAYHQIAHGRRVMRWAHAYGYFLDPEYDAAKQGLFDDLQSQANRWLECLHGCAELDRKRLFFGADKGESAQTFRAYREKVANLTGVTRKFMGNLVKAFETDLPEVVQPATVQIVNPPTTGQQTTVGVGGIISTATVKVEPAAVPQMVSAPAFSHLTPISNLASQGTSTLLKTSSSALTSQEANAANDSVQEHGHITNPVQQPICDLLSMWHQRHIGTSMGLPNIGTTTSGVTTTPMSGPGQPTGTQQMAQSIALGSFCSNTSTASGNSIIAASSSQPSNIGMGQQAGVNSLGGSNNAAMHVPIGQHSNAQKPPPNYVKIWEGNLAGQRQGQPVFICKLESWSGTASEILAEGWPETIQIVRLIAQEYMNNKQYVEKADFLIFRTLNQHGFLQQLQEKNLCAVIQLTSQTLLLSISDKAGHLIGMLFPEHQMLQQQQQLQHQQQLLQQLQQKQQLRDQQQLQQQQMQHQQQHIRQLKLQQNQLQHPQLEQQQQMQQMQHQQQQMQQMQQQQLWHQQQLHQQQQVLQQMQQNQQQQQQMQQMQPYQQLMPQMVSVESSNANDAREDWAVGAGEHVWGGFLP
ncbi:unnamed protein product [Urochloa humidicola]